MGQVLGFLIVLGVVIGGLSVSAGPAVFAALPFELALIGGMALGSVLIGNAPSVAREAGLGLWRALRGARHGRADYHTLLVMLHALLGRLRRGGFVAIEADIESPDASALFRAAPGLLRNRPAVSLICETLTMASLDPHAHSQVPGRLRDQLQVWGQERQRAVGALHTLADALPALGIVAAVLGIIKTMGVIDQSPAILGDMIAAALLGTFLGVFLAYGLIGPLANRFGQIVEEEALYLETIGAMLVAYFSGATPAAALERARLALPVSLRPEAAAVDRDVTRNRFASRAA